MFYFFGQSYIKVKNLSRALQEAMTSSAGIVLFVSYSAYYNYCFSVFIMLCLFVEYIDLRFCHRLPKQLDSITRTLIM